MPGERVFGRDKGKSLSKGGDRWGEFRYSLQNEVCLTLPVKYKGIKIVCRNGGLMVYPKNKLNFNNLKKQLIRDGYFYHSCYLPAK